MAGTEELILYRDLEYGKLFYGCVCAKRRTWRRNITTVSMT